MSTTPGSDPPDATRLADELAVLREDIAQARAVLASLKQDVAAAQACLDSSQAAQLLEANEQLVHAALQARADAATIVLALDDLSAASERSALLEVRSREAMARLNASLENRVNERTHELELARDEALAASRAKEQFLSNMSHEIRTPMNGMLGAMELLSHTSLTPRQAQYLDVAATSGEALLGVINDVLDFSKIGAGQLQLDHEPVDLGAIVRSIVTLFSAAAQRKALDLQGVVDPRLSGWHLGDALRLRQVLMNLVGNAVKFTARGRVTVRVEQLADGSDAAGGRVAFEVADTGMGIAASQHERVFEPFVQSEGPSSRRQGGTGLGLAISRRLVHAMGGTLGLVSAAGQGACFRFELPLRPVSSAPPVVPITPPPALVAVPLSGRVLLVEDNSVNRLIGQAMLEAMGLEVVLAEDGQEALARLDEGAVQLVLMDCQMPVMDGFEATERRREIERLRGLGRTPVIAVTANAFSGDVQRCLAAGMDAHLAKPFTLEQLRRAIAPWVGRRPA